MYLLLHILHAFFRNLGLNGFAELGSKKMSGFTNPFIYMTAAIFQATGQFVVIISSDPFI